MTMRCIVCGLIVLAMLLVPAGCKRPNLGKSASDRDPSNVQEADREYDQLIAGKDEEGNKAMEARQYLAAKQHEQNQVAHTSREQAIKWAEELYQAGAVKVYAVYEPNEETKVNS